MKIRNGFISNSSSSSFIVPSSLLTDEQKEMLLSIDDDKKMKADLQQFLGSNYNFEDSKNNYPRNEEYHRIYQEMINNDQWNDSGWDIGENKKYQIISGSTFMWNGSIEKFMGKIGIDKTVIEITNEGNMMVHMVTHPEAVKHFIKLHKILKDYFNNLSEEEKRTEIECRNKPLDKSPYEIDEKEFKPLGNDYIEYIGDEEYDYCYIKEKKLN